MPFDLDAAASFLAGPLATGDVPGVPRRELHRSPAAARVGALAAASGLFAFHYEQRVRLPWPAEWGERDRPDWVDGRLPEPKYAAFRHDLPVAGFHPGHRAKWSAHELCHALVGFGWRADAPPLWHATAARLAELLPVVLWYFLDEVRLQRCPRHDAPLFRRHCEDCEAIAGPRAWASDDAQRLRDARRFLDRELAAVARTRRLGVPVHHVHGSLDLCADGIAYAAAHGPRLASTTFRRYADGFLVPAEGWADHLDDLEARVVEVSQALAEGASLEPIGDRARWETQDLAWRLLVHGHPDAPLDALAGGDPDAARTWVRRSLPRSEADAVLAVGYGDGRSVAQIEDGLAAVTPLTLELLDEAGGTEAFVAQDRADRRNVGDRLADWLERQGPHGPALAALARYETALRTAGGDPEATALGGGSALRLSRGARVVVAPIDPIRLAERVEAGDVEAGPGPVLVIHAGGPVPDAPTGVLVVRAPDGELVLAEADPDVAEAVAAGDLALDDETLADLVALGVLVPASWPVG